MKTATISNILLTSSVLFFSACSGTTPKAHNVNKKTKNPTLSAYNIIGIDRSTSRTAPLFVVAENSQEKFDFIKVLPPTTPRNTIDVESEFAPQIAVEDLPEVTYVEHREEQPTYTQALYQEPVLYANSSPIISDTIDVISYAPTRIKRVPSYANNIEVISYGSHSSRQQNNFTHQIEHNRNSNSVIKNEIESKAKSFLGTKYVWGATGPSKFDCSGFTQWVYRDSGITIPRVSKDQAKVGNYVTYENLRRGDMVFFDTKKHRQGKVTHVGIYLGNNNFIHASSAAKKVVIYNFNEKPFYKERFLWGRRVINDNSYFASR